MLTQSKLNYPIKSTGNAELTPTGLGWLLWEAGEHLPLQRTFCVAKVGFWRDCFSRLTLSIFIKILCMDLCSIFKTTSRQIGMYVSVKFHKMILKSLIFLSLLILGLLLLPKKVCPHPHHQIYQAAWHDGHRFCFLFVSFIIGSAFSCVPVLPLLRLPLPASSLFLLWDCS